MQVQALKTHYFSLYSHSIKINSKNQSAKILSSASNGFALQFKFWCSTHAGYILSSKIFFLWFENRNDPI